MGKLKIRNALGQWEYVSQGAPGDTGIQGDTGVYGDTGIQGDSGYQGDTGFQGIIGDTGIQGDTGQGTKGDTGSGSVSFDLPPTDISVTGLINTSHTSSINAEFGMAMCINTESGGSWLTAAIADNMTSLGMPALYLCADGNVGSGQPINVLAHGYIRNDTWSWTKGQPMYVSAVNPGEITQTQPSGSGNLIQHLGIAVDTNTIYFNPNLMLIEHI